VRGDLPNKVLGVAGLTHDFEPAISQDADNALAEEDGVVGYYYTHGISA
jgi:hypothetical protein